MIRVVSIAPVQKTTSIISWRLFITTSRICPWCGGPNLRITNVMGCTNTVYWEDCDCGYREKTGYSPDYVFKDCFEPRQKREGK